MGEGRSDPGPRPLLHLLVRTEDGVYLESRRPPDQSNRVASYFTSQLPLGTPGRSGLSVTRDPPDRINCPTRDPSLPLGRFQTRGPERRV